MHIVDQSIELIKHNDDTYKIIERIARTCYKSEDKIKDGSAEKMVGGLYRSHHWAMFEHEYLYFEVLEKHWRKVVERDSEHLKYINQAYTNDGNVILSASIRAWLELFNHIHTRLSVLVDSKMMAIASDKYPLLFDKPLYDAGYGLDDAWMVGRTYVTQNYDINDEDKTVLVPHTIKFITSRAIANELVRHRPCAFAQESQRYVDYNGGNSDHQISVIKPLIGTEDTLNYEQWHYAMVMAECQYMQLRKGGVAPEIARGVLPNDCKTEIVVTATEQEWQHIINLRYHGTTGRPHPQMKELMTLAYPILKEESNGRIT